MDARRHLPHFSPFHVCGRPSGKREVAEEIIIRFRLEKLTCRCEVATRDYDYVRRGEHGDLCKAGQRLYDAATLAGAKVYQLVNGHLVEFPSHVPEADRAERDFQRHLSYDGELPSDERV